MILQRTFIDVKRLATTSINYLTRSKWLLDYVKSIIKPLEYTVNQWVKFSNDVRDYVKYTNQKGSLKVYVDDQVDVIEQRSYITENIFENLVLTGYAVFEPNSDNYTWVKEVDPNPTKLSGYAVFTGDTYQYILEPQYDTNQKLSGYVSFQSLTALQDTNSIYLKDLNDEYIFVEDGSITDSYKWILEGSMSFDIIFWIHFDIYNAMTEQERETLKAKLGRYVTAPYTYTIQPIQPLV